VLHLLEDQPDKARRPLYRDTLFHSSFSSPYPYRFLNDIKIKRQKYVGNSVISSSKVLLNSIHLVRLGFKDVLLAVMAGFSIPAISPPVV
jgi:hypothetical protein